MPFDQDKTVFGAEFDASGITKFANIATENLKKVATSQDAVNVSMAETTTMVDQNTAAVKKNAGANELAAKAIKNVGDTQAQVVQQFKKPIAPQVDLKQINDIGTKLAQLKKNFDSKAGNLKILLDTSELDALDEKIIAAKGEFQQINAIVDTLSKKLTELEPGTQAFEDVSKAVSAGNQVLKEYVTLYTNAAKATADGEPKFKSIRTRLKEYREELTRLEDAGEDETEQYKKTQLAAAKLTDQYSDMQQQVRILASDTRNLDFAVGLVQAAGAGFQAVAGGLELFGLSSKDAEAAQTKLLAIMSLVQGVQQLQNLLLKESVIRTVGANIATTAQIALQRILTITLGASAAASKTLQAALITTGVGALVVALGFLISKMVEWGAVTDKAKRAQEELNAVLEIQQGLYDDDVKAIDINTKLRNARLKQRNVDQSKIFEEGQKDLALKLQTAQLRILELQHLSDDFLQQRAGETTKAYKKRMEDGKDYTDNLTKEEKQRNKEILEITSQYNDNVEAERQRVIDKQRSDRLLFEKENNETAKEGKNTRDKELQDLKFNYEQTREAQIHDHTATDALDRQYQSQRRELQAKYRKEDYETNRQLAIDLETLQIEAAAKRIDNIGNEFTRRQKEINNNARKEREDAQNNLTAFQNRLGDDLREGLISPEQYAAQSKQLQDIYDRLFTEIDAKILKDVKQLNADVFQQLITDLNNKLATGLGNISTVFTAQIGKLSEQYVLGQISYEKYERELTKISNRETKLRLENTKKTLENEINGLLKRLADPSVAVEEKKNLDNQLTELLDQLSNTNRSIATNEADNKKKLIDADQAYLDSRLQAYSGFTKSIVGLVNQIDAAEKSRLERAITYQQKRVDYAQQIADKGNAEYLEMEQKRLDTLEAQKEKSAQKTLAINNALVLSEALVAVISAIAKAAAEGSFVNILAAAGAVIGAVGAGYAFVSSLDSPVPQFFEGTSYVEGPGGRDNVAAMLTRGERVVPVGQNQEYFDTLEAIHNREIPADVLNNFVAKYPGLDIPSMNMDRLGSAMDVMIATGISQTNQKLDQLTDVVANFEPIVLNTSLDQNGFAQALDTHQAKARMRKRS